MSFLDGFNVPVTVCVPAGLVAPTPVLPVAWGPKRRLIPLEFMKLVAEYLKAKIKT